MTTKRKPHLTVAGWDLRWLMTLLTTTQGTYEVSAAHMAHPVSELSLLDQSAPSCAIVTLSARDTAMDVRELLDRSPRTRFVFVTDALPLRPAVARVIRERGHAVLSVDEQPFVIAATAAALMAEPGGTT